MATIDSRAKQVMNAVALAKSPPNGAASNPATSGPKLVITLPEPLQNDTAVARTLYARYWAVRLAFSSFTSQFTFNVKTLLFPPLLQPTSLEFPLGVCTMIFTCPGPEIRSVLSFTVNSLGLTTVELIGVLSTTTWVDETNWLPFTVSVKPCST